MAASSGSRRREASGRDRVRRRTQDKAETGRHEWGLAISRGAASRALRTTTLVRQAVPAARRCRPSGCLERYHLSVNTEGLRPCLEKLS